MVRCHHCGRVVPAGGFCNLCGWEIPPDALRLASREDMPDWLQSLGDAADDAVDVDDVDYVSAPHDAKLQRKTQFWQRNAT